MNNGTFGNVILLCIMCSSALLAVESPITETPQVIYMLIKCYAIVIQNILLSLLFVLFESSCCIFPSIDFTDHRLCIYGDFYGGANFKVDCIWIYFA